jgi:hypothetical protein
VRRQLAGHHPPIVPIPMACGALPTGCYGGSIVSPIAESDAYRRVMVETVGFKEFRRAQDLGEGNAHTAKQHGKTDRARLTHRPFVEGTDGNSVSIKEHVAGDGFAIRPEERARTTCPQIDCTAKLM